MTRFITLSEELAVKLEEARKSWQLRKVQVLIEDDDVPEGHRVKLPLEDLEKYLEGLSVPTKVYVTPEVYKIKLRERVSREEYRKILAGLNALAPAHWDRDVRAVIVARVEEIPEEEQLEVEEIVITPKEVRA
ncbi:hypothetical protein TPV1_gp05 [Thermococcus prieurii virus 1]|uniref:hypothetical protein n=1 Tax=Thermococcus prieurii virus 1 TaxID=1115696 RepID=UPI00024FB20B|nr:hypothetical protein TPV1_gp05 [Thermococcus prieurii virus 1]AEY69054.1 hypothetical protein [Thermococcus prieurii virus 1]AFA44817.1 hypothetical protein [Thermococcus prieurii virus 1]